MTVLPGVDAGVAVPPDRLPPEDPAFEGLMLPVSIVDAVAELITVAVAV